MIVCLIYRPQSRYKVKVIEGDAQETEHSSTVFEVDNFENQSKLIYICVLLHYKYLEQQLQQNSV